MYDRFSRPNAENWGPWAIPAALALVALLLRLPSLGWGLPDIEEEALPMKKAFEMWGWDEGRVQWNPRTAGWPSLSFYVHLLLQHADYLLGRLSGSYENRNDFWVAYQLDPSRQVLLARHLSALLGAAVVAIGTRLAARLGGAAAALAVGGVLALSPLALAHSQMITPDILLTLFAALCVHELFRLRESGEARHYVLAAVWAGLGTASKYTPVLLTLSLYGLHLMRLRAEGRSLRMLGFNDRRLGYAALAAVLAFCLASPFTFGDLEVLRRDFSYQAMHMSRGHFGHESRGVGFGYYLFDVFAKDLGWPAFAAASAGLLLLARGGGRGWIPLLCFLPFFGVLGSLGTQFDRYMLPALLPLCLGIAAVFPWLTKIRQRPLRGAATVVVLVALMWTPLLGARAHHQRQASQSTQQLAQRFIFDNIPAADSYLIMEQYTPFLPLDTRDEIRQLPIFASLNERQRETLLDRPFYNYQLIPMYSARTELTAFYYDLRHMLAYDYIVVSSSVRGRYLRQREKFPRQAQFYEDLREYAEEVARFTPEEAGRGPAIFFYRIPGEGRERLLRDRGELERDFTKPFLEEVYPDHFLGFLDNAARHAMDQGELELADLFLHNLHAVVEPQDRPLLMEQMAYIAVELQRWRRARNLYRQLVELDSNNAMWVGGLGYAELELGEFDTAERLLLRCKSLARDPALLGWVDRQLGLLRERRSGP